MAGVLEGVTVLELVRVGPGAFCTMMLADMGADVIKIETPPKVVKGVTNEEAREAAFSSQNRNKRSVAINLKSKEGQEILHKLAKGAGVLVEGFKPGVMKQFQGDYETLRKVNPGLVYCSLSGYGQDGPYKDLVGHDINYISLGGALGLIGESGALPTVPLTFIANWGGASLHAVIGILLALMARQKTGKGQYVDISYLDSVISLTSNICATPFFSQGLVPERGKMATSGGYPYYSVYETKDGKQISIGCMEPWLWANLCRAVGREDLVQYQRKAEHANNPPDARYIAAKEQLKQVFLTKTRDEWFEFLSKQEICIGKVYSWDEVLTDPQVLHRKMVAEVEHVTFGKVKQIGLPIKLSDTPGIICRAGPYLGEHTDEVLKAIGYTPEATSKLRQGAVIA